MFKYTNTEAQHKYTKNKNNNRQGKSEYWLNTILKYYHILIQKEEPTICEQLQSININFFWKE